jgi:hypothetical protein
MLTLALLIDYALDRRSSRHRSPRELMAALAPAAGAAIFSIYVGLITGHLMQWAWAQSAWGRRLEPLAFITRRLHHITDTSLRAYLADQPVDALTFVAIVFALAMSGLSLARRRWLWAALTICCLLPALLIDLPATGRITSVLFPVFLQLALIVRDRARLALILLFALGQAWLAMRFFLWLPPF